MIHNAQISDNFLITKLGNVTIFAKKRYKDAIIKREATISKSFKDNKSGNEVRTGRGFCLTLFLDEIGENVVIRRYRHGGLLGKITGDIFWNHCRPLNEAVVSEKVFESGVKTVEVVAVIKRNGVYPFFKAEIVTKEIANAFDLIDAIKNMLQEKGNLFDKKREVIHEIALMVKKLHDVGVYHADLHLKNILLSRGGNGEFLPYIIDLDKSTLNRSLTIESRLKNLFRLDRSVVKIYLSLKGKGLLQREKFPISLSDRVRFFKIYIEAADGDIENWKSLIRKQDTNYFFHKFCWNVLGMGKK